MLFLIIATVPMTSSADEPIYGVIKSRVETVTTKHEGVVLIPGEVVEVTPDKASGNWQVKSISAYTEHVVSVEKDKIALETDFLTAKKWEGQKQFSFNDEVSTVCATTFHPNGTFASNYDCNCDESRSINGKLFRLGELVWAKDACDSRGKISPLSVFVLKGNGKLCQVELNFEKRISECYESYGQ